MRRCQFTLCSFSENWNLDVWRRREWNWWIIGGEKKMKYIFVSLNSIIPSAWNENVLITEISKPNYSLREGKCVFTQRFNNTFTVGATIHWTQGMFMEFSDNNSWAPGAWQDIKGLAWFLWSNLTAPSLSRPLSKRCLFPMGSKTQPPKTAKHDSYWNACLILDRNKENLESCSFLQLSSYVVFNTAQSMPSSLGMVGGCDGEEVGFWNLSSPLSLLWFWYSPGAPSHLLPSLQNGSDDVHFS